MEGIWSLLGGIAVFALFVFIYSKFIVKNATLDSLEMLPDERVLFEEDGVKVQQVGAQQPVVFISCKIRITNRRIIIAQKALMSKKMVLRALIDYTADSEKGTDLKASMRSAYLVSTIAPSAMYKQLDGKQSILAIPLGGGMLTRHQSLHIHSQKVDEILALLNKQAA